MLHRLFSRDRHLFVRSVLFLICLFSPATVFAHVKWFADESRVVEVPDENVFLYSIAWLAIIACVLGVGILLEKYLQKTFWSKRHWSAKMQEWSTSVFGVVIGAFLLVASYHGFLFSLDLNHLGALHDLLIALQALIGISFLIGFGIRVSAALLAALWFLGLFFIGPLHMLENFWVLGSALFALIHGRSHLRTKSFLADKWFLPYRVYAVPILRIFTGMNLLILGFSEKILRPELGLSFLQEYQWNFMQNLGVHWYSDYLFVFSAGAVEALFGVVFILGIVTRLNALVIGIFFTIPLFILGPVELIGHMPHFTIVILLVLFGAGERLRLVNPYK